MTSLLEAVAVGILGRLQPTDLGAAAGELIALVGPNGGGKTSLLRAIARVEDAQGRVCIGGEDVDRSAPARRRKLLAFLPASRDVAWPIATRDVIALGLTSPEPRRIEELVAMLELDSLADRPVNRLSTGERARVLLARALAPRPKLLLLDEPLSNLDPYWVIRTVEILRRTVADQRCAAIVSIHDLGLVERFDRALLVDDGRLAADLDPEAMLGSAALAGAFRVERDGSGWRIRRRAGLRSLP